MKREAKVLLEKSTDSILLAIEHFNRPWDRGRQEIVLVLLDRSFELLLKSIIVHKGGQIRERGRNETAGFDACVRKCVSDAQVKCLSEEEALNIQIINSFRDAAQHYVVDISEQQLYIYTQSGLSLYDKLLTEVYGKKLSDYLPERVLPVAAHPPTDFQTLMNLEFQEIKRLVAPGSRKRFQARAKLRAFAIIETSLSGSRVQPSEYHLQKLAGRVQNSERWQDIFPGMKRLEISPTGNGLQMSLRITKTDGEPIQIVPEGTPGASIVAVRRVNELGFYSLNLTALSKKLGISMPKLLAVIRHLKMQDDPDFFKEFTIGKSRFKRYSPKALDTLAKTLPQLDVNAVWEEYKSRGRRS
ncbi:MAG: DUF3644 domain-containing protein [Planctomycetota bacterium]